MATTKETATAEVIVDGKQAFSTIKEMENGIKALTAEWRKASEGSKEYIAIGKEIQNLSTKVADAKKEIKALSEEARNSQVNLQNMLGSMKTYVLEVGAAMVAAFSVNAIKDYFQEGVKAAIQLRDTEKILLTVLDGNKSSQRELITLAKQRSEVTTNGRVELETAEKFLAIQGRTPEQIRKTIVAAQDLAVVTGQGLQQAVEELDATMEGKMGKGLLKLSAGFKDLTKDQMYNGAAIDMIGKKYAGLAEDEAKTIGGQEAMAAKSFSALQRTVGEYLLGTGTLFEGALQTAHSWFDAMSTSIAKLNEEAKSATQKFDEQGASVANLVTNIQPLLLKYDDLKSQTSLSVAQQSEMKDIVAQVTAAMPGAATAFDKYGDAVSISTDRVRDYIKNQILLLQYDNTKALEEQQAALDKVNDKLDKQLYKMNEIRTTGTFKAKNILGEDDYSPKATQAEVAAEEAANAELLKQKNQINQKIKQLSGDALQQSLDNYDKDKKAAQKRSEEAERTLVDVADFKKKSVEDLQHFVEAAAVMGATETEKKLGAAAKAELDHRGKLAAAAKASFDKIQESYKTLMSSMEEMEGKDFARVLTGTQQEIRAVEDKFDIMLKKAKDYKEKNDALLTPEQKENIDSNIKVLELDRTKQINQVIVQAEKKFSDDVIMIHENLRVARMAVTARQMYEVEKKYDDARKEIIGAINFQYDEEIKAANGDADKVIAAAQHKSTSLKAIQEDIDKLNSAEKSEKDMAIAAANAKFEDTLNTMKLHSDKDLAINEVKIKEEVQLKYKKILEDAGRDQTKINEVTAQASAEIDERTNKMQLEAKQKQIKQITELAKAGVSVLAGLFEFQNKSEQTAITRQEAANTKEKKDLDKKLAAGLITRKAYDVSVAKMDNDLDIKKRKLEHDQAVRAKETALFNALIGVAEAVAMALAAGPGTGIAMSIITAALGAIQVGVILAEDVPQAAHGRYNVTGADDGVNYSDVPYVGTATTGLYKTPTLISEAGPEYVIDAKTTRNLQMNYPGVIDAIQFARVPQHASGNYPVQPSYSSTGDGQASTNDALMSALQEFNSHARNGIKTFVVYDDIRKSAAMMDEVENSVKIN